VLSIKSVFIHKFTSTSPEGKTCNVIERVLMHRTWHSRVFDVQSFRGADCDTDHYLVVAKIRERLTVCKHTTHRIHMERFNLKKLNEVEGKEQYRVEISDRFAPLVNLGDDVDNNRAWKPFRGNIKILARNSLGYYNLHSMHPVVCHI
jgi:hypothetical protein